MVCGLQRTSARTVDRSGESDSGPVTMTRWHLLGGLTVDSAKSASGCQLSTVNLAVKQARVDPDANMTSERDWAQIFMHVARRLGYGSELTANS